MSVCPMLGETLSRKGIPLGWPDWDGLLRPYYRLGGSGNREAGEEEVGLGV